MPVGSPVFAHPNGEFIWDLRKSNMQTLKDREQHLELRKLLTRGRKVTQAWGLTYQGNRRPAAGAKRRRRGVRVDREVRPHG